jgi:hypothetical protein
MKALQAKQKLDVLRKGNTGVFTSRDLAFLFEESGIKQKKRLKACKLISGLSEQSGAFMFILASLSSTM